MIATSRRAAGWSQRTLAERLGVPPQTVKRMEKGVGSAATLVAAMEALGFRLAGIGPGPTLHEQLRARRRRSGLTLERAALRSGLSRTTIVSLERGGGSIASIVRLLAVIAPGAKQRAPERSYWGQGDKADRDSRFTPADFLTAVTDAFGDIDLDPCAHRLSPVVAKRRILLDEGGDGLVDEWSGRLAFVNPPFSELLRWLRRAHDQWRAGSVSAVVCLVPVRTDSTWFQDVLSADAHLYFLKGRVRFLDAGGRAQPTPFFLMVVALGVSAEQRRKFQSTTAGYWSSRRDG